MRKKLAGINYIDLFAGAGGLSEGFFREGFTPVAHVEKDKAACLTLKTRIAKQYLENIEQLERYQEYLKGEISRSKLYGLIPEKKLDSVYNYEISDDNINELFTSIDDQLQSMDRKKIDIIIGGPPCQAYSLVGRSRIGASISSDKRNFLFRLYGQFLEYYKPSLFVFENVPGLITAGDGEYFIELKTYFNSLGYDLQEKKLNSADFGVLQNRKRIILIGWKKNIKYSYPVFPVDRETSSVMDLFKDLPELKAGETYTNFEYKEPVSTLLKKLKLRNNSNILTQHIARKHNDRDLRIYKRAIQLWSNEKKRLRYKDIPEKDKTHRNEKTFNDRFKVVNGGGYSHTVVAHIAKDGHYYIHPDINQLRSLSVREAARIQSFPDDYFFEDSRTSAFKQIGNAVPPLMAQKIAKAIKETFNFNGYTDT